MTTNSSISVKAGRGFVGRDMGLLPSGNVRAVRGDVAAAQGAPGRGVAGWRCGDGTRRLEGGADSGEAPAGDHRVGGRRVRGAVRRRGGSRAGHGVNSGQYGPVLAGRGAGGKENPGPRPAAHPRRPGKPLSLLRQWPTGNVTSGEIRCATRCRPFVARGLGSRPGALRRQRPDTGKSRALVLMERTRPRRGSVWPARCADGDAQL
jgi:hypothetical protein